jgi:hypothetical protein
LSADGEFQRREVVCVGRVLAQGEKLGVKFALLDDGGHPGETTIFAGKAVARCVPGGVYEVQLAAEGARGAFTWLRTYQDAEAVARWQTESESAEVAHRARKLERNAGRRNEMVNALAPLREAYGRADRIGRLALEVVLLSYLRRGD